MKRNPPKKSIDVPFGKTSKPGFEVLCGLFFQDQVDGLFGDGRFQTVIDRQPDLLAIGFYSEDPRASIRLYAFFELLTSEDPTLSQLDLDVYIQRGTGTVIITAGDAVAVSLLARRFHEQYLQGVRDDTTRELERLETAAVDDVRRNFSTNLMGRDFAMIPPAHIMRAFRHFR